MQGFWINLLLFPDILIPTWSYSGLSYPVWNDDNFTMETIIDQASPSFPLLQLQTRPSAVATTSGLASFELYPMNEF
jgi:hypothetical protein